MEKYKLNNQAIVEAVERVIKRKYFFCFYSKKRSRLKT